MPHIQLISSNGTPAHSGSRIDASQSPFAKAGDKAATSFEALLAIGRDGTDAGQAALEQPGDKESADAADTTTGASTIAAELPQLPEAEDGIALPAEEAIDGTLPLAQQARSLPENSASGNTTNSAGVPLGIGATTAGDSAEQAGLVPAAARTSDQKSVPGKPLSAAKAGTDPLATAPQQLQTTVNPEVPGSQQSAPGQNIASAVQTMTPAVPTGAAAPSVSGTSVAVPEPLGTSAWTNSFSQKVMVAVGRNDQLAEIRVNPPHLGPIEVTLTLSGDDNRVASVHFAAHHASVREAIENAFPRLREMLGEAGISLGNATVGSESSGRENAGNGPRNTATGLAAGSEAEDKTTLAGTTTYNITGKVDTFA